MAKLNKLHIHCNGDGDGTGDGDGNGGGSGFEVTTNDTFWKIRSQGQPQSEASYNPASRIGLKYAGGAQLVLPVATDCTPIQPA